MSKAISEQHLKDVCKKGQGACACKFLKFSHVKQVYFCYKGSSDEPKIELEVRLGKKFASGDGEGCPGWKEAKKQIQA